MFALLKNVHYKYSNKHMEIIYYILFLIYALFE